MGYYLLDHPNPHGDHFYRFRRGRLLAIVVHITAGLEDLDATNDDSAEATARYAATTTRSVSWHSGSDADSSFDLLPAGYTAWQCQGYNSTTYGHEISKRHTDWRNMPEPWRTRTLTNAAQHLAPRAAEHRIPRRHATRGELDHAIATGGPPVGFIGHWELDPARRSDPGLVTAEGVDTFPWAEFFALMAPNPTVPQEDDDMRIVKCFEDQTATRRWLLVTGSVYSVLTKEPKGDRVPVTELSAADYDEFRRRMDQAEQLTGQTDIRTAALVDIESREEQRDRAAQG